MLKSTTLMLLLCAASTQLFAHALWIETNPDGKPGKEHAVRVYYGEPGAGSPDKIADWWSNVSSFSLWLIKPDGSKVQLELSPQGDHFSAVFTPAGDGVYSLNISHNVEEIAGGTQYQFNASARVSVGKSASNAAYAENANELDLYCDPAANRKVGHALKVSGIYLKEPAADGDITVFSPVGWSKSIQADASGAATFVPEWPGKYLLETGKGEEVSGQPYEKIYRIATLQVEVAK